MSSAERPAEGDGTDDGGLRVTREDVAGTLVLRFTGCLDLNGLPVAEREVRAAEEYAPAVLLLDFSTLEFVDSSGVRLVLQAEERAAAAGRRLRVALGTGLPRRLFQVLGLLDRLDLAEEPPA
ncbi:MAG TPA: STAS domain-containing protein [Pseudonocardia sp.]|nr:STAS domain-containing protein [Pseudonocardia sp.]